MTVVRTKATMFRSAGFASGWVWHVVCGQTLGQGRPHRALTVTLLLFLLGTRQEGETPRVHCSSDLLVKSLPPGSSSGTSHQAVTSILVLLSFDPGK